MATTMTTELAQQILDVSANDQSLGGSEIAAIVGWDGRPNRLVKQAREYLATTPGAKADTFRRLAEELGIKLTDSQQQKLAEVL